MEFRYRAKTESGTVEEGALDADTLDSAARALMVRGLFPLEVLPADRPTPSWRQRLRRRADRGLSQGQQAMFARQLSDLLLAGVSVVASLSILEGQADDAAIAHRCGRLADAVREGSSIADALEAQPGTLPTSLIAVVRAGEAGGALEHVVTRIAGLIEEEAELAAKIRQALIYPGLVSAASVLTLGVLFGFLIPRLSVLYVDTGQQLPTPTRVLLVLADLVQNYGVLVLAVVGAVYLGFRARLRRSKDFAVRVGGWALRTPRLGEMIRHREMVQFTRTLATLISGGVPVLDSLRLVQRACGNPFMALQLESAREHVQQGASLSSALRSQPAFFGPVVTMIEVGERSGDLPAALERAGGFYGRALQARLQTFVRFLEPALILVLAAIVGFIVFSMMLPILELQLGGA